MRVPHYLIVPAVMMATAATSHASSMLNGTLKSISATSIVLTTKDGKNQTIPLGRDTMFMKGNAMVGADQIKAGMTVMVALGTDGKTAVHVMVK